MGRATTKAELLSSAQMNYEQLIALIQGCSEAELITPYDFSNDEKKKEAHWQRDRNLRDVVIHLYEWHQLLLNWVASNQAGETKSFIPQPYNWKTYGQMNMAFWQKHQGTKLATALDLLEHSHQQVFELANTFSNEQLFSKGVYPWTRGSTLGSYFVSTTASHYAWAIKKLKAHKKHCASR